MVVFKKHLLSVFMRIISLIILSVAIQAYAGPTTLPHVFSPGAPAVAGEVNENFQALATAVDLNASRAVSFASAPAIFYAGQLYFNTVSNTLMVADGSAWRHLAFLGADLIATNVTAAAMPGNAGTLRSNSAGNTLEISDGSSWRAIAYANNVPQRFSTSGVVSAGANLTINFGGTVSEPSSIAVWQTVGPNKQLVIGNVSFPVTFTGTSVYVTNNSGGTVTLTIVALAQ